MNGDTLTIVCPYCNKEIRLDEALTRHLRQRFEAEMISRVAEMEEEIKRREERLDEIQKAWEKDRKEREEELEKMKESLTQKYEGELAKAKKKMEEELRKKLQENLEEELKAMRQELADKTEKIKEFTKREIELRQEKRKLEEEKEQIQLEIARRLDEEKSKIKEEISKRLEGEHRLKDVEKDRQMEILRREIEEPKRKAEHVTTDSGESLEWVLEEILRENFKNDILEPVPRGIRGADVIHRVCNKRGEIVGTILWEAKKVKNWSDEFVDKLKEDQRELKAEIAAIVSTTLPKGIKGICHLKGVWIADYRFVVGLASALRFSIIEVSRVKLSFEGKKEKLEILYEYLSGPEFRQQIEGIVEAFVALKDDLEAEKRAMERIWAKREKQIERMIKNTSRMYGSLQGIVGSSLPELKGLELRALTGE